MSDTPTQRLVAPSRTARGVVNNEKSATRASLGEWSLYRFKDEDKVDLELVIAFRFNRINFTVAEFQTFAAEIAAFSEGLRRDAQ